MSEQQILYCLIAFVLGWLTSRMMGNGFSVGGQAPECELNKAGIYAQVQGKDYQHRVMKLTNSWKKDCVGLDETKCKELERNFDKDCPPPSNCPKWMGGKPCRDGMCHHPCSTNPDHFINQIGGICPSPSPCPSPPSPPCSSVSGKVCRWY